MKLIVIGTGYVGLVSGACFAEIGHEVVCVDKDHSKIETLENGEIPIYEPGLKEIVTKNVKENRLSFSTTLDGLLEDADAIFLAVGTPTDEKNGRADLKYVFAASEEIAEKISNDIIIVTKSTVPVGTGKKVLEIFKNKRPDLNVEVASNPEFLREGSAVDDFMNPDRIIIGAESENTKHKMRLLYLKLIENQIPVLFTNIATSELIKYSSNAFLAMKIAFANEMADICEGVGAKIDQVVKGMGMDQRIGEKYMQPGPGYGGSCFPKDTMALTHIAEDSGFPTNIIEAVIQSNDNRKHRMAEKIIKACGGSVEEKTISILGLTFKANTDDMRYSPSLVIIPDLIKQGAKIRVFDPVGMNEAKKELTDNGIYWANNSSDAAKQADALVILTEWEEFKNIDYGKIKKDMSSSIIVDLRNLLNSEEIKSAGFEYYSIG